MSIFLAYAVGLIALALLVVLPSLLRRKSLQAGADAVANASRSNLQVLREQLAALDADHAAGVLDAEQYRLARIEVERRALEEEQVAEQPAVARRAGKTALAMGLLIPVFVLGLYALLGEPQSLDATVAAAPGQQDASLPELEAMVDRLAKRLESRTKPEEGDLQGWTMLANSYAVMQRYAEASRALGRARELAPDDPQLMVDHADMMAMVQGQSMKGEPQQLVMRALQLDPKNLKALAMAGSWAFEQRDFAAAVDYWGRAKELAPPGSDFANGLENSLQQARAAAAQGGQTAVAAASGAAKAPAQEPPKAPVQAAAPEAGAKAAGTAAAAGAGQISGEVRVSDALAKRVRPTDTLFVFARATQGPRMPLAIVRRQAGDLPFAFTLDDSSAMAPQFRLSGFEQVLVGARISSSGEATPRSGDLMGEISPVATGSSKLVLVIDKVVP